jgi:hypothetical protein
MTLGGKPAAPVWARADRGTPCGRTQIEVFDVLGYADDVVRSSFAPETDNIANRIAPREKLTGDVLMMMMACSAPNLS